MVSTIFPLIFLMYKETKRGDGNKEGRNIAGMGEDGASKQQSERHTHTHTGELPYRPDF